MKKNQLLIVLLLIIGLGAQAQTTPDRPNILWIVSEDNSPFIGAYGDKYATTPHLDKLASQGVLYTNAFASAPVCAPTRFTLITGMYASAMGTLNMRSTYPIPAFVRFFPGYLKEAGYYTTNNAKKDYNTPDQPGVWHESSDKATYKNRPAGKPFFAVFNLGVTHESQLHTPVPASRLMHQPALAPVPPYHPRTPEMMHDWAQYYDKITAMDTRVGQLLAELAAAGLAENTIVFYYSDHGGVLGRSKRFMYESGLHVPLIIRFPAKYQHLAGGQPGTTTNRIVSFIDFAPTILNLAQVTVPAYLPGKPFLGPQPAAPAVYAFAFRGRMDERLDVIRSVRDKQYRYIRNYMPHKIYGQYLQYLWQAPSMVSWEAAYRAGTLNPVQAAFWQPKPTEELYEVATDPHNINNLAGQQKYEPILRRLREANRNWLLQTQDAGFLPEAMLLEISKTGTVYDYVRSKQYPLPEILETAEKASAKSAGNLPFLISSLQHPNPVIRYWAATGCTILGKAAQPARAFLEKRLQDPEVAVSIAAAEALYYLGEKSSVLPALTAALASDNLMARVQALNVLEDMQQAAKPALPHINKLVKGAVADGDYDVRAAQRLIEKLAG